MDRDGSHVLFNTVFSKTLRFPVTFLVFPLLRVVRLPVPLKIFAVVGPRKMFICMVFEGAEILIFGGAGVFGDSRDTQGVIFPAACEGYRGFERNGMRSGTA